jgi:hypothetical protein
MRIYVSSTYEDLAPYREATAQTLRSMGHEVVAMEDYVATDRRPLDKCLTDVEGSDLYIGLFAFRYGHVPPDAGGCSVTECEYRHAGRSGRTRLNFVVPDDAPWPQQLSDFYSGDETAAQRIRALRAEVLSSHVVETFSTPEELKAKVAAAVAHHVHAHYSALLAPFWDLLARVIRKERAEKLERAIMPYYAVIFVVLGPPLLTMIMEARNRRVLRKQFRGLNDALLEEVRVIRQGVPADLASPEDERAKRRVGIWKRASERLRAQDLPVADTADHPA